MRKPYEKPSLPPIKSSQAHGMKDQSPRPAGAAPAKAAPASQDYYDSVGEGDDYAKFKKMRKGAKTSALDVNVDSNVAAATPASNDYTSDDFSPDNTNAYAMASPTMALNTLDDYDDDRYMASAKGGPVKRQAPKRYARGGLVSDDDDAPGIRTGRAASDRRRQCRAGAEQPRARPAH